MDIWEKLYQRAEKEYHPEDVSPFIYAHHVVCALESEDGTIYTAFCIEACSGMNLVNNLCQIVFAIAVGFLLVTIFYRGGSLLPCIIVHSAINTLNTFANDTDLTVEMHLLHIGILIVITVAYTLILTRMLPKAQWAKRD